MYNANKIVGVSFVALLLLIGAGCNSSSADRYGKEMMKDHNGDMMMDDSRMQGIMMKDGQMMTEWEGGEMMKMDHEVMLKDGSKVMVDGSIMKKDGSKMMMKEGQKVMMDGSMVKVDELKKDMMMNETKGSYQPYSIEKIALAEKGKVVLFFHAPWCPNCRTIDADILKSTVPDGVTILKVDYDSSTDLKKKYGVTTQHTFVQVDKQGALIKKWSGGSALSDVTNQIQ